MVTGSLSAITAIAFATIPLFFSYFYVAILFVWDFVLLILWGTVFGKFHDFTRSDTSYSDDKDPGNLVSKMQAAVWIDLVCLLLWLLSGLVGITGGWIGRRGHA